LCISVSTCGALIRAASAVKDVSRCWRYWEALEERGVKPSTIVVGCMLEALVSNGKVEQAVDLLNKWKKVSKPNAVMYSTVVKGMSNNRQSKRALGVLREMRTEGIEMTIAVYNAVLDAQARCGCMEGISEVVDAMAADKIALDSVSSAILVKAHCRHGDLNKALEILYSSPKENKGRDAMIYNNFLDGCIYHACFDSVDALLEEMVQREVAPTNYTFGILVKLFARRRRITQGYEIIERMSKTFNVALNAQTNTCLMLALLNGNNLDKSMRVFSDLKAQGGADARARGSLLAGLVQQRRLEKAVEVVEESCGLTGSHPLCKGQYLEVGVLEKLFAVLGARGLADSMGVPLLEHLSAAKVPGCDKLRLALRRS